jgi:acetyltransferase-like isoleucine patch superfamily enzyme
MRNGAIRSRGVIPALRHAGRVALNRAWSIVLKHSLLGVGDAFNVDYTTRILGGYAVIVGRRFHGGRGLKIVIAHPDPSIPVLRIGEGVCLNEYVTIAAFDAMVIGDNVLVGSRAYIGNVNHGRYRGENPSGPGLPPNSRPLEGSGEMSIGSNVWIGEGAIIPAGVTIGAGAIVAAGAVVTKSVAPGAIVAGNPASVVREFDPAAGRWMSSGAAFSSV